MKSKWNIAPLRSVEGTKEREKGRARWCGEVSRQSSGTRDLGERCHLCPQHCEHFHLKLANCYKPMRDTTKCVLVTDDSAECNWTGVVNNGSRGDNTPKRIKSKRDLCICVHSSFIHSSQMESNLSIHGWMNGWTKCGILPVIKRNELLIHATAWKQLKNTLGEIRKW